MTSKLREFTALGYPAHVLNGVIGRAFARTKDERLLPTSKTMFAVVRRFLHEKKAKRSKTSYITPYPDEPKIQKRQTNVWCRATVQRRV